MRLTLLIILSLFSMLSFSQDNLKLDRDTLPAYIISNDVDTVGIAFTVMDVRKIDKSLGLLKYLELQNSKLDTTMYYYISLVSNMDAIIQMKNQKIINLTVESETKDNLIRDISRQLEVANKKYDKQKEITDNKDAEINELNVQLKRQKILKIIFTTASAIVVYLIMAPKS